MTKFGFRTRFRVLPRCFGKYRFQKEHFLSAEIEEIVTGNNTMTHDEYLDCRALHLTVEIFHNDSIFLDLAQLLERKGIKRSDFIETIHHRIFTDAPEIAALYEQFREGRGQRTPGRAWTSSRPSPGSPASSTNISSVSTEPTSSTNTAPSAYSSTWPLCMTWSTARRSACWRAAGALSQETKIYLSELKDFSLLRKEATLNTDKTTRRVYHYDFPALLDKRFEADPSQFRVPEGLEIEILHTGYQRELIESYIKQYTTTLIGLGRILLRANMNYFYQTIRKESLAESFFHFFVH